MPSRIMNHHIILSQFNKPYHLGQSLAIPFLVISKDSDSINTHGSGLKVWIKNFQNKMEIFFLEKELFFKIDVSEIYQNVESIWFNNSGISNVFIGWGTEFLIFFLFLVITFHFSRYPKYDYTMGNAYWKSIFYLIIPISVLSLFKQFELFKYKSKSSMEIFSDISFPIFFEGDVIRVNSGSGIFDSIFFGNDIKGNMFFLDFFDKNISISHTLFNRLFVMDNFTIFIKSFILFCFIIYMLGVLGHLSKNSGYDNYKTSWFSLVDSEGNLNSKGSFYNNFLIMIPIATFFLLMLVSSNDLLSLFVTLEGSTLCLYVLAALHVDNRLSIESGLKYFLTSAVFSCIFGASCFLIYFLIGSTDFYIIRETIYVLLTENNVWTLYNMDYLLIVAVLMVIIVFLMKLGSVPYHFWIGDIYQGTSLIVMTFFATIVRISFFSIFFKLVCNVFFYMQFTEVFINILNLSGFLSIIIGSFLALSQTEIKRFLAYSSIVHTGFILIGLSTMSFDGFKSSILYMIIYIFVLLGFLICFMLLESQKVQKISNKLVLKVSNIKDLPEFKNLLIGGQLIFTFFFFSMAGLPPFPGFIIKLYVFKDYLFSLFYDITEYNLNFQVVTSYYYFSFLLFTGAVIISILVAFNYIRIIGIYILNQKEVINDAPIFDKVSLFNLGSQINRVIIFFLIFCNLVLMVFTPSFYYSNYFENVVNGLLYYCGNANLINALIETFINVK